MKEEIVYITKAMFKKIATGFFRLKSHCKFYSTGIIKHSLSKGYITKSVIFLELDENEMTKFVDFYSLNASTLQSVGFDDSSAIFCALQYHNPIIVLDNVTEKVCQKLKVPYVKMEYITAIETEQMTRIAYSQTININNEQTYTHNISLLYK